MADRILAVAKASYLLRDNDNLYLGKVRAGVSGTEQEIRKRIDAGTSAGLDKLLPEATDSKKTFSRYETQQEDVERADTWQIARQLVGQPAGPGVNSGPARILNNTSVLTDFKAGEVSGLRRHRAKHDLPGAAGRSNHRTPRGHADPWRDHCPRIRDPLRNGHPGGNKSH